MAPPPQTTTAAPAVARTRKAKIGRVLKTAASSPLKLRHGARTATRPKAQPAAGEQPIAILRARVVALRDILAKDKSGTSDPYVVLSLLRQRFQTPTVKRTLNPTYSPRDATFDFPIHASLLDHISALELVVWDRDMLRREYIGETAIRVEDWFKGPVSFDDPANEEFTVPIESTRKGTPPSGVFVLKLGFVAPSDLHQVPDFETLYTDIVKSRRTAAPSLISAPPTEGMGTLRLNESGPAFEDDGLSSDDELDTDTESPPPERAPIELTLPPTANHLQLPQQPATPSGGFFPKLTRKIVSRRNSTQPADVTIASTSVADVPAAEAALQASAASTLAAAQTTTAVPSKKRPRMQRGWSRKNAEFSLSQQQDVVGIVMLEIQGAEDLPKIRNMTRTGWDMDPFCIVAFSRKVFRTRVLRHSLNPVWDEKLLFHVRRYETGFKIAFSICDWDKITSNDNIGEASLDLSHLLADCPQPDPETGLYPFTSGGTETHDMKTFKLNLSAGSSISLPWESKHTPTLTIRAKYQPYEALRQHFWWQYLKQYDADDTGTWNKLEITSMLDSLGSTLTKETIDDFFLSRGKTLDEELSLAEVIHSLEAELRRPAGERKSVTINDPATEANSLSITPALVSPFDRQQFSPFEGLDFSGHAIRSDDDADEDGRKPSLPPPYETEPMQQPIALVAEPINGQFTSDPETQPPSPSSEDSPGQTNGAVVERVINIRNCPLCHRPRLNSKAEVDIITHLAVCASGDWGRVDRMITSNFITANQASRKWYTKVLGKVSKGAYSIGANSANIIVQNRTTGQLEEEKMQVYIRLGIRLLYKGAKSRMEGARARRLLKSLSIKQGQKYDSPESAAEIPAFIAFHKLNVDEVREPLNSFKTFNEFFYRKLKDGARPVADPEDPSTLVSAADCRLITFDSVTDAQKLWIKAREFTVQRLLGDAHKDECQKFSGGPLAIFRLAPQDYHRFHCPVDGTIDKITHISGEYYTVNPQAIRTTLDVFGENVRTIVSIDSPVFGRVIVVCVGAMMVGSILLTVEPGDIIKRGQELGYFAFGGSTLVVLFQKGSLQWDEDLRVNGHASLETLVRVGMRLGKSPHPRRNMTS
ncbi:phosphatidylserine decarboxylase-domain-containing protein [Auriculariales sp. MPI-PUGE-AT-0066]|nr:phosphatidylserine decarboxylase-domain-containing protein [Auriculariales sp. MPI-PUGE-AT-0066]